MPPLHPPTNKDHPSTTPTPQPTAHNTTSATAQPPIEPQKTKDPTLSQTLVKRHRVVYTTATFLAHYETQTMYLLQHDSPHGRTLRQHRDEWSEEEYERYIQEHATSHRPLTDQEIERASRRYHRTHTYEQQHL